MKVLKVTAITVLLGIGLLATAVSPVFAQVAPGSAKSSGERVKGYDDWHFSVNLAGWLTSFQGDVTAEGDTSNVNVDLKDVLDLLFHGKIDFTMDGRFEVSKGPWGFYTELEYVRLSDSAEGQKNIDIPIFRPPGFTIQGNAKVMGVYSVGEAALTYDVYASPCLVANMPELVAEVLGGARYQYIRTKADLELAGPLRDRSFESDDSKSWVDPFVGGRILWRPGESWITSLETDFGGFGVGSDFTFNIRAEAAYRINRWFFVNAGYRALYTDYEREAATRGSSTTCGCTGPFWEWRWSSSTTTKNEPGCPSNVGWARVHLAHRACEVAFLGGQLYRFCPPCWTSARGPNVVLGSTLVRRAISEKTVN